MIVDVLAGLAFLLLLFAVLLIGKMVTAAREPVDLQFGEDHHAGWLARALARAIPQLASEIESIGRDLKRAGNYKRSARDEYLAIRNGLIIATLLLTMYTAYAVMPSPTLLRTTVVVGFVLTIGAYGLPRIYLNWTAERRVDRIQAGLPDALDMATMCVGGGMPMQDALQRVGTELRETHPDVASEFDIVRRQAAAQSMGQAMQHFAARVDAPDIRALASIVTQTERLGTNIASAMRDFSEGVRDERHQRAVERANRMSVQMMLPIIFCLSPMVYILLCAPPILQLADFFDSREFLDAAETAVAEQGNTRSSAE